eukprot:CAMPEP_0115552786 /NCGR_PEP_ID=MMETSP0271-20121206/96421_1 /TAXON_ID=71861 /ORGANISM="Scrippsiella trochoidea, Strain CCMP3099" /LENGTH=107 /DNA_ID=CAMNT_0002986419 /DNA_START=20 /DNA_END=340 /DNA_ORIENTATION=+
MAAPFVLRVWKRMYYFALTLHSLWSTAGFDLWICAALPQSANGAAEGLGRRAIDLAPPKGPSRPSLQEKNAWRGREQLAPKRHGGGLMRREVQAEQDVAARNRGGYW